MRVFCVVTGLQHRAETVATVCDELTRLPLVQVQTVRWHGLEPANVASAALLVCIVSGQGFDAALAGLQGMVSHSPVPVIVVTDSLSDAQVIRLLDAGVREFAAAPIDRTAFTELAVRLLRASHETDAPAAVAMSGDPRLRHFIGRSAAMTDLFAKLPTMAACAAGLLIVGETGTGKELFARAVHYLSARAGMPWVAVNCGAIANDLIEDELFGHVRGAYTTAHARRPGLVSEAEGGTLFLDDIDCLPLSAQAKLLRFLQEHEYRAVGSDQVRTADVRIVAASNRNLHDLAQHSAFRQDLFYRLSVLTLALPPLRERRADIHALAMHFTRMFSQQFDRPKVCLGPRALARLLEHDWPGNVRELEHVVERAVLLAPGPEIDADDLDIAGASVADPTDESFRCAKARAVERFERNYIEQMLARNAGNVSLAAREAHKNRRAFFAVMRKHGIDPQLFRDSA